MCCGVSLELEPLARFPLGDRNRTTCMVTVSVSVKSVSGAIIAGVCRGLCCNTGDPSDSGLLSCRGVYCRPVMIIFINFNFRENHGAIATSCGSSDPHQFNLPVQI